MLRSIRWTLQLWHAGLLAVVLLAFGGSTFFEIRRSRYAQLDADLERSSQLIAAGVRPPRPRWARGPDFGGRDFERRDFERGDFGRRGFGREPATNPASTAPALSQTGQPDANPGAREFRDGGFRPPEFRGPDFDGRGGPPDFGNMPDGPPKPEVILPASLADRYETSDGREYFVVFDRDGAALSKSARAPDLSAPARPAEPPRDPDGPPGPREPQPPRVRSRDGNRESVLFGPFGVTVVAGRSIAFEQQELRRVAIVMSGTGGAVLIVGLVGGLALASRVVRPIRQITAAAESITAANLSRRIDVADTESELGSLATVLNNAFGRLESAFRQQVRFVADASHELRTPLAVLHSSVQLALSRDRSAEEYRKTLQTCQRASTRMKDLVDSLLLLAGADSGGLKLDRGPVELADVVAGCAELIAPLAAAKQVSIETELNAVTIDADATRVGQVVTNLLSNAVRYNRDGGRVRVTLSRQKDGQGDAAVLSVADTGVGIAPEHQQHLFERFYRVDPARTRVEGGSGLGLAIVQSIVAAHGGSIAVDSRPGEGTTFTIRLPTAVQS